MADFIFIIRRFIQPKLEGESYHGSETEAYQELIKQVDRLNRSEIDEIDLIDCRPLHKLTTLQVMDATTIPWSWTTQGGTQ